MQDILDETSRHYIDKQEPDSNLYSYHNPASTCRHKSGSDVRNLVVCIDGTANQFGPKNTNVIEFYNLIEKEVGSNQLTWYNSGIGTYVCPSWLSPRYYLQLFDHIVDLAVAWNFKRTILAAYRWLSDHYQESDRIFLFGFSRGAFQVRVLSAMIAKVGLIHRGNEEQIPFAYEVYSDSKAPPWMADRFKTTFSHTKADVHYVGVWDTVSSIGLFRGKSLLPGTVDGMKHVCYFRHALALDERRVKFGPEYAYGGSAAEYDINTTAQPTQNLEDNPAPHTLEVWFAGTHSDIGGGNVPNENLDRSTPPLRWMVFESSAAGLRLKPFQRISHQSLRWSENEVNESLTAGWWILECIPFGRLTYTRRAKAKLTTHKPHMGKPRKIHDGQKIHGSVIPTDEAQDRYTPKALPLPGNPDFWGISRDRGLGHWEAVDLFEQTRALVNAFIKEQDLDESVWDILRRTATSNIGRQAVYEGTVDALLSGSLSPHKLPTKVNLVSNITHILDQTERKDSSLKKFDLEHVSKAFGDFRASNNESAMDIARTFLRRFTTFKPRLELVAHKWAIPNVAVFPNGMRIVSGLGDCTLRSWDTETGATIREYSPRGTSVINVVLVSPNGRRIVSGSKDGIICLWNADSGISVGGPLVGHNKSVRSLAISPDGRWVASGSEDMTVRIWDITHRIQVCEPLGGHGCTVCAVGFSRGGTLVVSCSIDKTVRVWDAKTRQQVQDLWNLGAEDRLLSAAFSLDGTLIAAAFSDESVCIWNLEEKKMIGKPFRLHRASVSAISFSNDGRKVVTGSSDGTVLVWDVKTQKSENSFQHRNSVCSVAFFLDGEHVVIGCEDGIIRIWPTGPW